MCKLGINDGAIPSGITGVANDGVDIDMMTSGVAPMWCCQCDGKWYAGVTLV